MVSVVNSGVTKDSVLAAMVRNIWLVSASYNIQFKLQHVQGVNNKCADLLSRWHLQKEPLKLLCNLVSNPVWIKVTADHLYVDLNI